MSNDIFTRTQKFPHLPAPVRPVVATPETGERLERLCAACGAPANFGFGVDTLRGKPGTWYCAPHRGYGG